MFEPDDFDEEIRSHLAMAQHDRIAQGEDPDTAYYAARKEFGNVTLTTEAARHVWTSQWTEGLLNGVREVHQAIRALAKSPAFALMVMLVA
jgi:hypothetical protein